LALFFLSKNEAALEVSIKYWFWGELKEEKEQGTG